MMPRGSVYFIGTGIAPAASATDVLTFAATQGYRGILRRLIINGVATAAGAYVVNVIRRVAANTGGTSSAVTPVACGIKYGAADVLGADPISKVTVLNYSANPSALGATTQSLGGGVFYRGRFVVTTSATPAVSPSQYVIEFDPERAPFFSGAELISVNLNAATMTGGVVDVFAEWDEYSIT